MLSRTALGSSIKRRLKELSMTQRQLADGLGVTNNTVSRWVTGSVDPPLSRLPDIASLLQVAVGDLFGADSTGERRSVYGDTEPMDRLALWSMGHIAGTTDAEPEIIDQIIVTPAEKVLADRLIRIHGDSMEPTFLSGDYVGLSLQEEAAPSQVVLAEADGELTFKVWGGVEQGKGILLALNPRHRPIIADEVRIIGVYRWMKRVREDGRI